MISKDILLIPNNSNAILLVQTNGNNIPRVFECATIAF